MQGKAQTCEWWICLGSASPGFDPCLAYRATGGGEKLTPHGRRCAALEVSAATGSGAWLHGILGDAPNAAVLGAHGARRLDQQLLNAHLRQPAGSHLALEVLAVRAVLA